MSIAYLNAEDEIFGVVSAAWLAAIVGISYAPTLFFPGAIDPARPVDEIYAECSLVVVKEAQTVLANQDDKSIYESTALFAVQVYSPKSDPAALRTAKVIGSALLDAFCKPSPSGEIWFRDQRLTPVSGNTTKNQLNVVITCVYRTIK